MGTLLEDLQEWYKNESYPPDGSELDYWQDTTTEQVSYEVLDSVRWGNVIEVVYRRSDEYVAVKDVEPATEMQDWGDYGDPDIYAVEPYEVVVVKYRRK